MIELDAGEQDLPGEEVGETVGHPDAREVGQEGTRGVAHHQVLERQVVHERARDRADLQLADDDPVERARDGARQEIPAGRRQRQGGHHPQHHGHRAEHEHEEDARDPPVHQNACPTAKWNVNLLFRLST